ncbi:MULTISPECIES: type II toxin-antitoxin system RelE/ParE family toxin [unclassified Endozoicomonas]|uniref:type II toxin-antitoxin system RelE/ParE family toxin n=1 Tax=unclassified Endozoicomonas TaxID=2644528 RepID=UPI0021477E72|nr:MULTISPECIES: type II toxin-antitoxin system RelE/ParE family toxin [unclassified Endozoicomonas]
MRVFKNKAFSKWAFKEGLSDDALLAAVSEIENGLVDADLGGQVLKKRVAIAGRGKRAGLRTILAYQFKDKAFFVYGFAKNAQANIDARELKALRAYARTLLSYDDHDLDKAVTAGILLEIRNNG